MRRNLLSFAPLNVQHCDLLNRHKRLFQSVFFFVAICLKLIKKDVILQRRHREKTEKSFCTKLRKLEAQGFKQPEITEGCDFIQSREGLFDETAHI